MYEIERELGQGTSALVYLARSVKHDRFVALKVLRPELTAVVGAQRFLREIEIAAKLTHPHILPLLDSHESEGLLYFVTPYIGGQSLRERLEREGRLRDDDAIRLTTEIAGALDYAHRLGVIHRDIKPENILLQDDRAIVADFGISLNVGLIEKRRLTESGLVIGTPSYMSPEQIEGRLEIDPRTDIYSLGCVLYEMLVGEPPFEGPTPQAIIVRHVSETARPLRELVDSASPALEATLSRALAKDPEERFATAREFAHALEHSRTSDQVQRRGERTRTPRWQWVGAAVVIVLLGVLAYSLNTPKALHDHDWLVVADFDGPPSDPRLGAAFRDLITTELDQSRFVSTLPRQQLNIALRDAGLPDSTTINSDLARELAVRSAVRAVVSGSIQQTSSNRFRLSVRVVDAERGNEIATLDEESNADSMLPAIATLARRLRERLGEERQIIEADRPLLSIATPSLPAYRKYVDAIALKQRGDLMGSNRALAEALVRDTGFASAWALLGMNYVDLRNLDSARAALSEALRRPERLTDANRYRLNGDAAFAIEYDLEAAVHWYDKFLRESPNSIGGRNNHGLYLSLLGRHEEALAEFERAISVNPLGPANTQSALLNETAVLIILGHRDRAEAVARNLMGPFAADAQLQLANAGGDPEATARMAVAAAHVASIPGWLSVDANTSLASSAAARGRIATADAGLREAGNTNNAAQRRWYSNLRALLAMVAHRRLTEERLPPTRVTTAGALVAEALSASVAGDSTVARADIQRLDALSEVDSARLGQDLPVLRALLDRAEGGAQRVIARMSPFARHNEHDATNLDRLPAVWSRWLVADAYAHEGLADSSIVYYQLAIADTGIAPGHLAVRGLVMPFVRASLAREYEIAGNHAAAKAEWRTLTTMLRDPDREGASLAREAQAALTTPR